MITLAHRCDRPTRLAWFSLGSLPVVEIGMRSGADMGVVDLQHGLWDRHSAYQAIGIIGPDRALVRAADASDLEISRALDTGAAGVIVPLIESAEQAASAVAASRFAPAGRRSAGGVRPIAEGFGRYLRKGDPVVAVMIETRAGLENAERIAAVDGVSFVFIGPGDLSLSLGIDDSKPSALDDACAQILLACQRAQRPCGIFTPAHSSWSEMISKGFSIATAADDISVVSSGFQAAIQAATHHDERTS